ncbi:MAG: putative bifunctional diguanylate cyclase/phosphodiesterase, partial [Actinomycetes bacterium]
ERVHRLNAAILVTATLIWMWVLAADDALSAVAGDPSYVVVASFLVLDAVIIGFAAGMAVRTRIDQRPDARALLVGVLGLMVASLLLVLVAVGSRRPETTQLVQGIALGSTLLVAIGARRATRGTQDAPGVDARTGLAQRWAPVVAVSVALPMVVVHEYLERGADLPTLLLGGTCVALAIYRLNILERDQRRLAKDLRRVADRLNVEAHSDALTGLGNRAGLAAHLGAALERSAPSGIALFYIDVDHFKSVNDGLGHEGGDELLVGIGERLRNVLGEHVFRLGGDEFVAVREDLDRAQSEAVAAALVAAMEQPVHVLGRPLRAAVSVGLARSEVRRAPDPSADSGWPARRPDSPESILRRADLALYRAKELGRGRWATYDPWLQQRADRLLQMQQGLHRAVAQHEFDVYFQPVVDLTTRRTTGAEALVRWRSPDHGLVLPNDFLPAATHAGLLPEIGRLVIEAVECRLDEVGDALSVSVNLSPAELSHPAIVARLLTAADHAPPGRLWVGVHEASVVDDTTGRTLRTLREHGVKVVVEGFGAGPSSLRHLADYPADAIAVDRSFVDGLDTEVHDTTIVEAVARLGQELGLLLAAQGVTDERQADRLTGMGYRQATGWLFGRPMPWPDFTADHLALPADGPVR